MDDDASLRSDGPNPRESSADLDRRIAASRPDGGRFADRELWRSSCKFEGDGWRCGFLLESWHRTEEKGERKACRQSKHKRPLAAGYFTDVCPFFQPQFSEKELNREFVEGTSYNRPLSTPKTVIPGGPGSQWRMMKLKRVYETATDEGKPVEEVALERYGSLGAFEEAKEERRVLDDREQRRGGSSGRGRITGSIDPEKDEFGRDIRRRDDEPERQSREERLMFTDFAGSGASSRSSSFRRPGGSVPTTPSPGPSSATPLGNKRIDALKLSTQVSKSPLSTSHTPIPSVMTPPIRARDGDKKALSQTELNKLQAKVLRAKLMGSTDADKLEKEYEEESRRSSSGYMDARPNDEPDRDSRGRKIEKKVEILPTLDAHGRLYDIGSGGANDSPLPGNRQKKDKASISPMRF